MRRFSHLFSTPLLAAFFFAVLVSQDIQASNGYPLLFNFSYEQYGADADLQNWDITQSEAGEIFVGNNNCMLRFDGNQWQKVSSYGDRIYRSVCAIGDRIYMGRYNEFGYLERDNFGDYTFTSLSAGKPVMQNNEEIWNIIGLDSCVYFQSFNSIYAVTGDSVRTVPTNFAPYCIFSDSSHLYVQAMNSNFYRMDGDRATELFSRKDVGDADVVGFFKAEKEGEYTVVTNRKGIFRYADGQIRRFETEADDLLCSFAVNKTIRTHDGNIVLGTFRTGIICLSKKGKILWHYDAGNGLKNACILRLLCDCNNNIWACMDEGVTFIANGSPYRIISSGMGGQAIGMVYSICRIGDRLLIATNQGVYRCQPESTSPKLELLPATEGQNWHLTEIDSTLFCGHNSSLLRYRNGNFEKVQGTSSSSTCMRLLDYRNEHYLIESSYSELRLHKKKGGDWAAPERIKGFLHPVRQLEVDADGTIWATDMRIGVYRITLSDDLLQADEVNYFPEIDGLSGRCFVMRFGGRIVFSNGQRLYRYDDTSGTFKPYERLNNALPWTEGIISITESSRGKYCVSSRYGYAFLEHSGDKWQLLHTIRTSALGYRSNDVAAQAYVHDGHIYFNMADAVVIYDSHLSHNQSPTPFFLHKVTTMNRKGKLFPMDVNAFESGKSRAGDNLHLQFSFPTYLSEEVYFEFEVKGPHRMNTTQKSDRPEVLLTGLQNGRNHLTARAIRQDGTVLHERNYTFRIIPPWYRSWWCILLYVALIMLIAQLITRYQVKKKTERQRLQLLEQDRIISEQKQQLLESELALKSKDLASLSLDAAIKDDVIDSIQQAIRLQQKQGNIAQGTFNAELLRIRQTTSNEKNWAVFQQNFDLIHEHFFRNLKEQFPSLTTSDLRLCALLRLNMATKDIATYTGLSVRGVESARFRLRKKLHLDAEQNLSEFLLSFK